MEAHKRRSNLSLFGVPEEGGNSCVEERSLFVKEQLHIDTPCKLLITKRVGRLKVNGTRPIVTTFVVPEDRLDLWGKKYSDQAIWNEQRLYPSDQKGKDKSVTSTEGAEEVRNCFSSGCDV